MIKESIQKLIKKLRGTRCYNLENLPLDFDANYYFKLNPDVAEHGLNPFQHYLKRGAQEGRKYKLTEGSQAKNSSPTLPAGFDPETYRSLHSDLVNFTGNLDQHYLEFGVTEGRRYSPGTPPRIPGDERYSRIPKDFDADAYMKLNPDIAGHQVNPYDHYLDYGIFEKRPYAPLRLCTHIHHPLNPEKPTIILISSGERQDVHQAFIGNIIHQVEAIYNTVVLNIDAKTSIDQFSKYTNVTVEAPTEVFTEKLTRNFVSSLVSEFKIEFAILSGLSTWKFSKFLTVSEIPTTLLVTDNLTSIHEKNKLREAKIWSTNLVFTNAKSQADAVKFHPASTFHNDYLIDVVHCTPLAITKSSELTRPSKWRDQPPVAETASLFIVGYGEVCFESGIDLFIETAREVLNNKSNHSICFIWFYPEINSPENTNFFYYIKDQIYQSGFFENIELRPTKNCIDAVYKNAHLMLLTARVEPLPLTAMQAIAAEIPVICFDGISPLADLFKENQLEENCVSNYMCTSEMAQKTRLLLELKTHASVVKKLQIFKSKLMPWESCFQNLIQLCKNSRPTLESNHSEVKKLIYTDKFDLQYYIGTSNPFGHQTCLFAESAWSYILEGRCGFLTRKPMPGFNPEIYRERLNKSIDENPFFHYLANPESNDYHAATLLTPASFIHERPPRSAMVALHVHAYYTDLLPDILDRALENQLKIDIYVTVKSDADAVKAKEAMTERDLDVNKLFVYGNVGRDVYPFLQLSESLVGNYEIIGHVHTKKSPHLGSGNVLGINWRELLLGNLLGSAHCERMADGIIHHMLDHPSIQIVFPDDPHILDWGPNVTSAKELLSTSEFDNLPLHFEFPAGTMFWARSEYIKSIIDLDMVNRFQPIEPLAIDGTVLHAWERLLGATVATQPHGYALTYVPGLYR